MLVARTIRIWAWLHKWSSLVCTVFMLLLCLTGLPLIFHHQLDHLLGNAVEAADMPAATPRISIDRALEIARERWPGKAVQFASQEADDDRIWFITLSDSVEGPANLKQVAVDARTGQSLGEPPLDHGFMWVMYSLHVDLFAGLAGKLFLGFMGLLLLIAIVSGVVLYAPFMRKLRFGEVRRDRATRTKWLDLHNLLGIVTLTWAFVVGATGMINTWADLAIKYWQFDQMTALLAPYKNQPPLTQPGPLQPAIDAALKAEPAMRVKFVAFPGTSFSSPHHYGVFMRGDDALTSRLLKPVLVDALSGRVTDRVDLPWYLTALLISQPLHFGDYGGVPMQILWALLDIVTIVVLGSGLYLWLVRRKTAPLPELEPRTSEAPA